MLTNTNHRDTENTEVAQRRVVLQLIDSFNQGGSERQALQLTRLLVESGRFKVHLACLSPEGSLRDSINDLGLGEIPSFPLNSFTDRNAVRQLRRFVRWLKASRIDILHTHDFYTNIFGMAGGGLARLPVRVASMRETAGMRSAAQKQVQRIAYSMAHHVVANSNAVREKLISDGVTPEKVSVIYNGLDVRRLATTLSRAEALSVLGLPAAPRFISIVANMRHDVKDYPMFLRSARRVKSAVPDAAFLLAGEGELSDSLRGLAEELGISDSTFFLGRCEKVAELLAVSEICVLSSKAEGFSNSILEYMAAGRPVVVTEVGGAREVVAEGETGYLVPSGDDAMMAERLIALLGDSERARAMGAKGKRVVESKFSCEAQLAHTESLYDRLLER
ncbi:MAG TPA: glycosyltransferase family 4 protein [Pyrinomonadaceae bacterium]|nr:glycosyltransferase family 4 protein [Pyrinomonadaceae bacterium]